MKANREELLIT